MYRLPIPEFLGLSWTRRPFHNEMVSIAKERYEAGFINYRRLYLLDLVTMCEAEAFQLRQVLFRFHAEGRISLTERENSSLGQRYFDNYEMYKLTWKTFAKHHGKELLLRQMLDGDGVEKMKTAFAKRNAVSHPKVMEDLRVTPANSRSSKMPGYGITR